MNLLPLIIAISALAQMPNGGFLRSMSCTAPWGKMSNGTSVLAYSSNLPAGPCVGVPKETRTCQNSVLSGSYLYNSCTNGCTGTPWGNVNSGFSGTAYYTQYPALGCGSIAQNRVCNNGTLSGSYNYTSCVNGCAAQSISWTVGSFTCTGNTSALTSGSSSTVSNTAASRSGSVTVTCSSGTLNQQSGKTCTGTTSCGGTTYGGYCWYLGAPTLDCDSVCSGHGGSNASGTVNYVGSGSGGSTANCYNVLNALGDPLNDWEGDSTTSSYAIGCTKWKYATRRCIKTVTTTSENAPTDVRRVCACNN